MGGDGVKTLRETLISELGMGMSRDELIDTVDDSVKISTVDGRGVVAIPSEVDSASSDVECTYIVVGNISINVENASIEAGNASIELKIASVDVENASTEVEMKAGEDGAGDGVKLRVSSSEDIGMSLLLEDMCKTVLENMLSDSSIIENGIRILEENASTEVGITTFGGIILEALCEYKSVVMIMFEEGTADMIGL